LAPFPHPEHEPHHFEGRCIVAGADLPFVAEKFAPDGQDDPFDYLAKHSLKPCEDVILKAAARVR